MITPSMATPVLAQQSGAVVQLLVLITVFIFVVIGLGVILMLLRRRFLDPEQPGHARSAGLMESLRGMRKRGEISEEEYERIRRSLATAAARGPGGLPDHVRIAEDGTLVARSGYDLTGQPLPGGASGDDPVGPEDKGQDGRPPPDKGPPGASRNEAG